MKKISIILSLLFSISTFANPCNLTVSSNMHPNFYCDAAEPNIVLDYPDYAESLSVRYNVNSKFCFKTKAAYDLSNETNYFEAAGEETFIFFIDYNDRVVGYDYPYSSPYEHFITDESKKACSDYMEAQNSL